MRIAERSRMLPCFPCNPVTLQRVVQYRRRYEPAESNLVVTNITEGARRRVVRIKACKVYATIACGKTTGMEKTTVWDAVLFA